MLAALLILASLGIGFAMGFNHRVLRDRMKLIEFNIAQRKVPEQTVTTKTTGTVLDADDPALVVRMEYKERMEKLNPHIHREND